MASVDIPAVAAPTSSSTFRADDMQQRKAAASSPEHMPAPRQSTQLSRRSDSLHRRASAVSQDGRSSAPRSSSESRKQVVRIQNYVIYRKTIGQGSMGKVKLAECLTDRDQQKYAVKIMPKMDLKAAEASNEKPKDPKDTPKEREQRTVRELAIMHLLRHPNICQLKEYVVQGDYYYMFLEYVDGGQLLDYIIQHGKLREKQARKFARQIASALDYCHRNSIVHRDLKIENILLTQDENIKIIDFGLSNIYSPSRLLSTFCGSLYFAAPELLKARHYTGPEVDVWSFGVVLYVLVCGRVPFDDTSLPALHAKIKSGIVDEYPDHLSKDCIDLLSRILVVDPRKRLTLSGIENHTWMKKGYDEPIQSMIPKRDVLETIDMDIVRGMHGFGLGDEHTIKAKMDRLIHTDEYKQAVYKINHNQQVEQRRQHQTQRPLWRRSLSTRRPSTNDDDPLSLPAMYDPLLSIYYLVKERKEYDTRRQLDQLNKPIYHGTGLSRSTSTVAPRPSKMVAATTTTSGTMLVRRKTDGSKSSPRVHSPSSTTPTPQPAIAIDKDIAAAAAGSPSLGTTPPSAVPQRKPSIGSRLYRNSSVRLLTRSVTERTNSIRDRSKSAVKILGSMLPNRPFMFANKNAATVDPVRTSSSMTRTTSTASSMAANSAANAISTPPKDENLTTPAPAPPVPTLKRTSSLKAALHHASKLAAGANAPTAPPTPAPAPIVAPNVANGANGDNATPAPLPSRSTPPKKSSWSSQNDTRKTSKHLDPNNGQHYQQTRRSWRQLSLVRQAPPNRMSMDPTEIQPTTMRAAGGSLPGVSRYSESDKDRPSIHNSNDAPRSKFHLSRNPLFRSDSAHQLLDDLRQVLTGLNILVRDELSSFNLVCQCGFVEWSKWMTMHHVASPADGDYDVNQRRPFVFKLNVYQAKWVHGRYGIKVKDMFLPKQADASQSRALSSRICRAIQRHIEIEFENWLRLHRRS
ncbi:hypothetical protein BC940DRAFT_297183 [Gongronella butleri]|nr:hypothetical protein BC940DRAFT_297183 [Gongronella butleri]